MSSSLHLYYDLFSQPSRAQYILFKINSIPAEFHPVSIRKREHLTAAYKAVNRFQKVPCIIDGHFNLSESVAILLYLDAKGLIDEKWYPKDVQTRARIDEYLAWHQNNTRRNLSMYSWEKWLKPIMFGKSPNTTILAERKAEMEKTLDTLENVWLEKTKYLVGNEITVADLFAICEMGQPRMAGYNPGKGRPKLDAWLKAVRKDLNPHFNVAHSTVDKLASVSGIILFTVKIVNFFRNLFRRKKEKKA